MRKRANERRVFLVVLLFAILITDPMGFADNPTPSASPSASSTVDSPLVNTSPSDALATPSPKPTVPQHPPYLLPKTVDGPVPKDLKPSLADVAKDRPTPYQDRCHTQQNLTASLEDCIYGNPNSKTTIVLFGDSHALSWFPAIELLAKSKNWRLLSLTMSSCWPSDIPAWNSTKKALMPNCAIWRKNTLKQIVQLHPAMVFVTGTRGFSTINSKGEVLVSDVREMAWEAGMKRTLDTLKTASSRVIFISDTPLSQFVPPTCLATHKSSILACSTPISAAVSLDWLGHEADVATSENVTWIDPTTWVCPSDPCSPISGKTLVYVDGGHLTATFARTLEKPLWKEISK
ncbi:MAG: SGNH hydrolase domain-containing protein [Actinobacteria bacterium]|nr:SGNH hydrolase domain-containing protein [Actinomycetota bacterium]